MSGIPIASRTLDALARAHGGVLRADASTRIARIAPVASAGEGDLAPLLGASHVAEAERALARGATLLVDEGLASARASVASMRAWFHPYASWAMAEMLTDATADDSAPTFGENCLVAPSAVVLPRVRIGARVTIAPGAVIGAPGFGFAFGPSGKVRDIPQLGGVIIEDDVHIGALCTIASGTLGPTILRRGAKLDAQVHVGHNCEVGEKTIIAAQTGLAGSVVIGRGVLVGGQVGIADHLTIGDGARIAAKSGVIGDVDPGATVAGYPAVPRSRWLRGLAELYRLAERKGAFGREKGTEA